MCGQTLLFIVTANCAIRCALTLLVGRQEGHPACKRSWMLVCWRWHLDRSFAHLTAPVVTITCIILSSNKIQNGDIPALTNTGAVGKRPLKCWERFNSVGTMRHWHQTADERFGNPPQGNWEPSVVTVLFFLTRRVFAARDDEYEYDQMDVWG